MMVFELLSYGHITCTDVFSEVHIYYIVTTSGIAGFQGNSNILDKDGTQKLLLDSFKLLHEVHNSGGFYGPRGNFRC